MLYISGPTKDISGPTKELVLFEHPHLPHPFKFLK